MWEMRLYTILLLLSSSKCSIDDSVLCFVFSAEEVDALFVSSGLVQEQLHVDRRLQVNRGRQLKMYRVWIQAKYKKLTNKTQ